MDTIELDHEINLQNYTNYKDGYSELALKRIIDIQKDNLVDFIEAVVLFCEEQDIDVLDFHKNCDQNIIDLISSHARKENKVRKLSIKNKNSLSKLLK